MSWIFVLNRFKGSNSVNFCVKKIKCKKQQSRPLYVNVKPLYNVGTKKNEINQIDNNNISNNNKNNREKRTRNNNKNETTNNNNYHGRKERKTTDFSTIIFFQCNNSLTINQSATSNITKP